MKNTKMFRRVRLKTECTSISVDIKSEELNPDFPYTTRVVPLPYFPENTKNYNLTRKSKNSWK
jgi:hypothetical protein